MKVIVSPYWRGWAVIAFSLFLFVGGAPYWVASLERVELPQRTVPAFADTVMYPILTVAVPQPLRVLSSDSHQAPLSMDTARPKVLLFGDSMIEWMRFRLARWLKEVGYDLYVVIWPSSNLIWWAQSDTLLSLIETLRPKYILISIGGNELLIPHIERRKPYLEKILQQVGGIPYVWIGPPNWTKDTGINDLIARAVGPGRFFASWRLTFDRLEDGAHPTPQSAYRWADSVVVYLRDSALTPLLFPATPPASPFLSKPRHTILIPPHPPHS